MPCAIYAPPQVESRTLECSSLFLYDLKPDPIHQKLTNKRRVDWQALAYGLITCDNPKARASQSYRTILSPTVAAFVKWYNKGWPQPYHIIYKLALQPFLPFSLVDCVHCVLEGSRNTQIFEKQGIKVRQLQVVDHCIWPTSGSAHCTGHITSYHVKKSQFDYYLLTWLAMLYYDHCSVPTFYGESKAFLHAKVYEQLEIQYKNQSKSPG